MTSFAEDKTARQISQRLRDADSISDRRVREANAHARALARAGRQSSGGGKSGSTKSNTGESGGRPFRLRFDARSNVKAGARHSFTRTPRAPKAISHFRFERKYSNRAGAHGSPTSAKGKILYDTDHFTSDEETRVKSNLVYAPPGTPRDAIDPIKMAEQCEATAGRQVNSRQMAHDTISLPKQLTDAQRERLAMKIAERISTAMDGVPVYASVHEPDGKNGNYHTHTSAPLRHVIDEGDGKFSLGKRVAFEQRPAWREAHGLEKTNHSDLRNLRAAIAGECADALVEAGLDHNTCERWRHGYLRLNGEGDTQTARAKARGDVEFVEQNQFREVQVHEGPGRRRTATPTPAQEHNTSLEIDMSPRLLAGRILRDSINQAKAERSPSWESLREIAAKKGLTIEYVQRQHKNGSMGKVTGWRASVMNSTVTGQQAGITFRSASAELKEAGLAWAATPPEYTPPPEVKPAPGALRQATEALVKDAAATPQAPQARAVAHGATKEAVDLLPAAAARRPIARRAVPTQKKESKMNVNDIMAGLTQLPGGHESILPTQPPQMTPAAPTLAQPRHAPTENERRALEAIYPDQPGLEKRRNQVDRAREQVRLHAQSEPRKWTLFSGSSKHDLWAKEHQDKIKMRDKIERIHADWLNRYIYSSPTLMSRLGMMQSQTPAPVNSHISEWNKARDDFENGRQTRYCKLKMQELEQRYPDVAVHAQQRLERNRADRLAQLHRPGHPADTPIEKDK